MKPQFIIFNDTHIKQGNEDDVIKAISHMVDYALDNDIKDIIFAGDLMHSRTYQKLSVLKCVENMLDLFDDAGLKLHSIPGNHDKSVYTDIDNFQDAFMHHPVMNLYRDITDIKLGNIKVTMLPFFTDELLNERIENYKGSGDILVSHFSVNGSTNLGHVTKSSKIDNSLLKKKWKKTYLGHFHNTHEVNKNIIHLPSLFPQNFGEDNNKGFSAIYDDLSYSIIKGNFKKYIKVSIDIEKQGLSEIKELIKEYNNSSDIIRFELSGDEEKVKQFDKSIFENSDIDIKMKRSQLFEAAEIGDTITSYDKNIILEEFEKFCDEKGYDHKEGLILLNEFLNK